jgi:hypothetical protein
LISPMKSKSAKARGEGIPQIDEWSRYTFDVLQTVGQDSPILRNS